VDTDSRNASPARGRADAAREAVSTGVEQLTASAASVERHEVQSFTYRPTTDGRDRARAEHAAARLVRRRAALALRAAVFAYAWELKRSGASPEQAVVLVKTVVRGSMVSGMAGQSVESVLTRVVSWCIEAYYGPSDTLGRAGVAPPGADGVRYPTRRPWPLGAVTPLTPEAERLTWALVESTYTGHSLGCRDPTEALREATCDYALALRYQGFGLEQVLDAVAGVVQSARDSLTAGRSRDTLKGWGAVSAQILRWSTAVYIAAPGRRRERRATGARPTSALPSR
jgi:hypothetical protein